MSGIFLKDGARVIGAGGEPADDLADMVIYVTTERIFFAAEKKFSRMTFMMRGHEISLWDSFCHSSFRNGGLVRNRVIVDFIDKELSRHIADMSNEMRWLIELTACDIDNEDDETLNRELVFALIYAELRAMIRDHGRVMQSLYDDMSWAPQRMLNGASPA